MQARHAMHRFDQFRFALSLAGVAALTAVSMPGCSASPRAETVSRSPSSYSFWPQFPAEPRIQFLVSYQYSSDLEEERSEFDKLVFGDKARVLPIAKPYGIHMWNGRVYVCDIKNPGVVVLDLIKRQTRVMGTAGLGGMQQPTDIAIASDGMKYVADPKSGVVYVFSADERHVNTFGHSGFNPVGIEVFEDRLYACDFESQSIIIMDRFSGDQISSIGGPGGDDGQFVRPLGIDVDKDGNIYVCDVIRCRLQWFDSDGRLLGATGEPGDSAGQFVRPKHLAVDSEGIVYIPDAAFDNVQMFNAEGEVLMFFGSGGDHPGAMNLPAGVCINETDIEIFSDLIHPDFNAERLILVTNQFGNHKVAVYAMGELREGVTAQDISAQIIDMRSPVLAEDASNPLSGDVSEQADDPEESPESPESNDSDGGD